MTQTDLSPSFRLVAARRSRWDEGRFAAALRALEEALPGCDVDWEPDDEAWARLLDKDQVRAVLRISAPLAFLIGTETVTADLARLLEEQGVVAIRAQSWEDEEFRLDDPSTRSPIGLSWDDSPNATKTSSFSLSDLWYETVGR